MSPRTNDRTPDRILERIAAGDLPPDRLAAARAKLASEPDGEARLAALEADNAKTLQALPPADVAREVERRFASQARIDTALAAARRRTTFAIFMPLAAATAALALYVRPDPAVEPAVQVETPDEIRFKGDPALYVYRSGRGEPEQLHDGDTAKAGDTLQLKYVAGGRGFGVVLSIDGRGSVTLHHPAQVGGSTALKEGTVAIDRAYRLDDAPAFERFFFVASPRPLDVREVLARAERAAHAPDPESATLFDPAEANEASVLLRKAP